MEPTGYGAGWYPVLRRDDDEIRSRLPKVAASAMLIWHTFERLANERKSSLLVVRCGLLEHLSGCSKRTVRARCLDLERIGFLCIKTSRTHDGNQYALLRGMSATTPASPTPHEGETPATPFDRLKSTGKFPNLTREALVLVARGYPGVLDRHADEIAERARSCPTGALGDPVAWLRRRLSELEHADRVTPPALPPDTGPPAGAM